MTLTTIPSLRLHDEIEIPRLAFGVFGVPPEETQRVVEEALEAGYRHIDTAASYGNEEGVGAALAAAGLPREDYFVTTKLWSSGDREATLAAFEASLDRLGLDHVDLYAIDRPVPAQGGFLEAWRTLEEIHREEAARTIGVCGFAVEDLQLLEQEAATRPTINQIELYPHRRQAHLRAWQAERSIVTAAWNPLAEGEPLDDVDLIDFEFADEELVTISGLDNTGRIGSRPLSFVVP